MVEVHPQTKCKIDGPCKDNGFVVTLDYPVEIRECPTG